MIDFKQQLEVRRNISRAWRDWTEIVQLFAGNHTAREKVQESSYRELHQKLTSLLENLGDDESEACVGSNVRDEMEALLQPWMSVSAFRSVDPRILKDLVAQCQTCQSQLDGSGEHSPPAKPRSVPLREEAPESSVVAVGRKSNIGLVVICVSLFLGMFAIILGGDVVSLPNARSFSLDSLMAGLRSSWYDGQQEESSRSLWMMGGGAALVLSFAAWAVFRPPRSY